MDARATTFVISLAVALACSRPPSVFAQTAGTGAIRGAVTDPSSATVLKAEITVVNEATGETRTGSSAADGTFHIELLSPGSYRVEARKVGFKVATRSGVSVNVTETTTLAIRLELGTLTETIIVDTTPPLVQTESSSLGRVVDERAVENLPLVTRNYTQIIALSPGIASNVTDGAELGRGSGGVAPTGGTSGTFVHGARGSDNNYQMDGVGINDAIASDVSSGGVAIPNPDTIQEFKVQTGQYDASFGRNAGANVNIVTKGGSNEFHGNVFEFFRNEALNANEFFFNRTGQKKPILRQNQFGFILGGPVKKDKLSFFTSYQGTRQLNGFSNSPTATCRASVFSPPLTNDRSAAALGALFVPSPANGNYMTAIGGQQVRSDGSNINPVARALLNFKLADGSFLIPTPQKVDPTQAFASQGFSAFTTPCVFDEDQFMANVDYLQSPKSKFSGRFFFANSTETITFPGSNVNSVGNLPGFPEGVVNAFRNLSLTHTYVLSPSLLNEARFGFHRIVANVTPTSPFKFSDLGVSAAAQNDDLPAITIQGSFNFGAGSPGQIAQNIFDFADALSYVQGRHSLRFGGGLTRIQANVTKVRTGGDLLFLSFPDFLLGLDAVSNGTGAFSNVFASIDALGLFDRAYRSWDGNLYMQDDIRVTPSLTLNAGFRYERLGLPTDGLGRNSTFDPSLADPNPPFTGTLRGYVVASNFDGTVPQGVRKSANPWAVKGDGQNTSGPRLGFSWKLLPRSNRLVSRGGYGIYYSRPTGQTFLQSLFGAPFALPRISVAGTNAGATFANPFAPAPSSFPVFVPYSPSTASTSFTDGQDLRTGIVQQYSLNVQAQIKQNLLLEIGYAGARGTHLVRQRSVDQAMLATASDPIRGQTTNTIANIPLREPIPGFTPDGVIQVESEGASEYDGLEASLTKRFSHGLQFLASYTFAKTLDTDGSNVVATAAGSQITLGDQNDPRRRYGRADFSRPHRFVLSYLYELPAPSNRVSGAGRFLGGWSVAGVVTIQAGQALTISNTNGNNVFGISEDRAQIVPGCASGQLVNRGSVNSKLNNYFNVACFTNPPVIGDDGVATAFGNSGVGIVDGPDQRNVDVAIIKRTYLRRPREHLNLEFRAEFFNAFNTSQFANPDTSFSSSTFGRISSTSVGPRIVQFALKVNF